MGRFSKDAFLPRTFEEVPVRFVEEGSFGFQPEEVYTETEEEELKERLRSLNYLK